MGSEPKLILLNGFAGSGKSTLANRYVSDYPMSINIEGDQIIAMIGGWKENYDEARKCVFPHTKAMIATHLGLGYDVVVPYLLVNSGEVDEFEHIAERLGVRYLEILLYTEREIAIRRLMERGRWGEEGLPDITEKDLPEIFDLYDRMEKATAERPNAIRLEVKIGDIEGTYKEFLRLLN